MLLGRYTVLGKLATGGMAEVFLGQLTGEKGFERRVIIKRVLPQYATDKEFLRLFEAEARFASYVQHPHVTQVADFGVDPDGLAYLVMEYVDGASLRALITAASRNRERPDVRLVCRIFSQVAEGLAAVHGAVDPATQVPLKLVHRDVSPENILLSRQGAVKLSDFGIARAMSEVSVTQPNQIRGKLHYLAPEQLLGQPISPAIDVWALGVSLYETLALKRPFPEDNEGATMHGIAQASYPPLGAVREGLPAELLGIVHRCLELEPEQRYPDCHDLALELERIASSGSGSLTAHIIGNWVERLAPAAESKARALTPGRAQAAGTPRPGTPPPAHQRSPVALTVEPEPVGATPGGREAFDFSAVKREDPPPASTGPANPFAPPEEKVELELTPLAQAPAAEAPQMLPDAVTPGRSWRGLGRAVAVVVVLAVLASAAIFVTQGGWKPRRALNALLPASQRQVIVNSTPAGAKVKLGNVVVGVTPWAGDLPSSSVEVTVELAGYKTAKVVVAADQASVTVTLKR
ncbi:MAG: serine/threonine-protein kinase [Myxococcaceae bacterium]